MKLKRFLLRYYPPGIILEYESKGDMKSKDIDLLDLSAECVTARRHVLENAPLELRSSSLLIACATVTRSAPICAYDNVPLKQHRSGCAGHGDYSPGASDFREPQAAVAPSARKYGWRAICCFLRAANSVTGNRAVLQIAPLLFSHRAACSRVSNRNSTSCLLPRLHLRHRAD